MSKNFNSNTINQDEWLTPKYITDALGHFDLDPCSPGDRRPWDTADVHIGLPDDGLSQPWFGRVWCNPPYGRETFNWLNKLSIHKNGIALIFARTETIGFHKEIWNKADSIFFFKGRLKFYYVNGTEGGTANAPSCLVSYSSENTNVIKSSNLNGKLIFLR
jgi:hypothetical protein